MRSISRARARDRHAGHLTLSTDVAAHSRQKDPGVGAPGLRWWVGIGRVAANDHSGVTL